MWLECLARHLCWSWRMLSVNLLELQGGRELRVPVGVVGWSSP